MKVIIYKTLEEFWGTDDDLNKLDDLQVVELLQEDISALLEDATWEIIR